MHQAWLCKHLPSHEPAIVAGSMLSLQSPGRAATLATGCLRVRGLPPEVTAEEVLAFFRGYGVSLLGIEFSAGSPECVIQLASAACAKRLLTEGRQLFLF